MKISRLGCLLGGIALAMMPVLSSAGELPMYFASTWKAKKVLTEDMAAAMAKGSGLDIRPHIVNSNAELIAAFAKKEPAIVYVGSMVTAVLYHRGLIDPLAQGVNDKEMYTSVLIVPLAAENDATAMVKEAGTAIAYAKGFSSGELGAKAASDGQANIATETHEAALGALRSGKAKAAFVKNWWWEDNKKKYPKFKMLNYPGVSELQNPDNVLSASKAVTAEDAAKIKKAVTDNYFVFQVRSFRPFEASLLKGTLELMAKAKLDPSKYP
ncbi:MAG: PhnD/SsuA/transferrin family substrate-binding protein [Magnetococcales bacterium]|nr:PhnD/SsuA/transferrin family substrate-binding protein [Magnetococcales bacterium]